jgi:G3E family GTPase
MLEIVAITGFLGSGKTTLLRHWLEQSPMQREDNLLIINDFGAVNVDAASLARHRMELRSIAGGCVCCTSFAELIRELDARASEGRFARAWLETSGLAEPEEVLDHLTCPQLQGRLRIRRFVQVVDAPHFPSGWRHRAAESQQLAFADAIVINKTDLVTPHRLAQIEEHIRHHNSHAEILPALRGRADVSILEGRRPAAHAHGHPLEPGGCCHLAEETVPPGPDAKVVFMPLAKPVNRQSFHSCMEALPDDVYRAKGHVRFADAPGQIFTFQRVRRQHETLVLPVENGLPSPVEGLIFIGPAIDDAALRQICLPLADTA